MGTWRFYVTEVTHRVSGPGLNPVLTLQPLPLMVPLSLVCAVFIIICQTKLVFSH